MFQNKSATRPQQPTESSELSKYRQKARQLQELFPTWSIDDLQWLLSEVQGDVEVAATRISDGVAEQWDSVSRKKDKKGISSTHSSKDPSTARGSARSARGGRGGRSGPGRGGAVRGRGTSSRGGAVNGRSPRLDGPSQTQSDGALATQGEPKEAAVGLGAHSATSGSESTSYQNGVISSAIWTDASTSQPAAASNSSSSWGGVTTWGNNTEANGVSASASATSKPVSKPAMSKLSWAEVARPQEKLVPPPTSTPASVTPATSPADNFTAATPPQISILESGPELPAQIWEEPTTAQPPTWDDEPQKDVSSSTATWDSLHIEEPKVELAETQASQQHEAAGAELLKENFSTEPEKQQLSTSKSEPAPIPALATPVSSQSAAATPSPKLSGRPAAGSHRASARYKNIDQPVVMPSSFSSGIEKIEMQFGSLGLGGENLLDSSTPDSDAAIVPEPPSPSSSQTQVPVHSELSPAPIATPASTSVGSTIFSQQQAQPAVTQGTSAPPSSSIHSLPSSVAQQTSSHANMASSPIQQFAQHQQSQQQSSQAQQHQHSQPHSLGAIHQQQLHHHVQHIQSTPQIHNQYSQHGLPTHIDPSQQVQSQQQAPPHSNYFGRGDGTAAPYFHTPTPPAGQAQDSPYGSFGQLSAQAQHQQGSHLGGFGTQDYGYGDNQRGFYESYQQAGFSNRNVLSHEDVKGLQATQQQPPAGGGIAPAAAQSAQPHGSLQPGGQPPQSAGQAPQQGYPLPYPYYTYPQSQPFYSYSPNYAQPFKYPAAMYQPPPGPGSAPSPVAKQPGVGVNVQAQGNPYSQSLYAPGGYDDYQQHPHHAQHTQQHSHGLSLGQGGVGASDYGKQLYGAGQNSMQGFMGLGQGAGGAGGPTSSAGGPRGAGSPETPYKPYAPKDVSSVAGGRGPSQQAQVQSQNQGQGQGTQLPQGQPFFSGARFGAGGSGGSTSAVGAPQQSNHHPQGAPQGHLGYPPGNNDGNFYPYRGQQYWQ